LRDAYEGGKNEVKTNRRVMEGRQHVCREDEWKVVIRYDSAHEYSHVDKFYRNGRSVKKELHLNLKEALTLADEDIKDNWKAYQKAFMED